MPAVTFENVTFSYSERLILPKTTFAIEQGSYVGIIGPNGSGKSTLVKLLVGLLTPNEGTIQVDEKKLGFVPQTAHLDRKFPISVFEIVLSGRLRHLPWYGRYTKRDREIALEALQAVRLEKQLDQPFGSLSTGQAQRCLIARALASKPEILVLDEPTASVDPTSAQEINQLLKSLAGTHTIVVVTHDLQAAIHDADQVFVVQEGVRSLKPEQVCKHFAYGLYHTPMIPETH